MTMMTNKGGSGSSNSSNSSNSSSATDGDKGVDRCRWLLHQMRRANCELRLLE